MELSFTTKVQEIKQDNDKCITLYKPSKLEDIGAGIEGRAGSRLYDTFGEASEHIQALEQAVKAKDTFGRINRILLNENEKLRSKVISLKQYIVSILTENNQLKAKLNKVALEIEHPDPWSYELRESSAESTSSKDKAVSNLSSEILSRSLVAKPTLGLSEELFKEEPLKIKLEVLKEGIQLMHMGQKNKRKRSDEDIKTSCKRSKVDYTCSKCGPFKASCLPTNYKAVHHYCGSFPKIITFTHGKVHRTHGSLVLRGIFTKRQMSLKLKQKVRLSKLKAKKKP